MTLILTEVSRDGIAMAADSMVSYQDARGNTVHQEQWQKLFKVDDVGGAPAGVSFWGNIGNITDTRFDKWLEYKLAEAPRNDLLSLANYLTEQANLAARNKLLANGKTAGFHVAGYHPWSDGKSRPTFFHIHNGHLSVKAVAYSNNTGSPTSNVIAVLDIPTGSKSNDSDLRAFIQEAERQRGKIDYSYDNAARKQFEVHADFPSESASLEVNLAELDVGHMTRNGDPLNDALIEANGIARPLAAATVGARLGFLVERMKVVINKYACTSNAPTGGGKILTLAICHDGTYFNGLTWSKTR